MGAEAIDVADGAGNYLWGDDSTAGLFMRLRLQDVAQLLAAALIAPLEARPPGGAMSTLHTILLGFVRIFHLCALTEKMSGMARASFMRHQPSSPCSIKAGKRAQAQTGNS